MSPVWRKRLTIPLLALLGLNAVVYLTLTLPRQMQERSLFSREATLREEVTLQSARAAAIGSRVAALQSNAADARRFETQVVGNRRADLVPALRELTQTAEGVGLKLDRQSYTREMVTGLPVERFRITLPLAGTYSQLAAFIAAVERSPRFVTVDRVALNEGQEAGRANLNVAVSAYFRADNATP